jgi:hypothetical protein
MKTAPRQRLHRPLHQRLAAHLKQRLGRDICEGPHALAAAGGEDHGGTHGSRETRLGSGEDASADYRRAEKKPPQAVAFAPGRRPRVAFYCRLMVKAPAAQLAEKAVLQVGCAHDALLATQRLRQRAVAAGAGPGGNPRHAVVHIQRHGKPIGRDGALNVHAAGARAPARSGAGQVEAGGGEIDTDRRTHGDQCVVVEGVERGQVTRIGKRGVGDRGQGAVVVGHVPRQRAQRIAIGVGGAGDLRQRGGEVHAGQAELGGQRLGLRGEGRVADRRAAAKGIGVSHRRQRRGDTGDSAAIGGNDHAQRRVEGAALVGGFVGIGAATDLDDQVTGAGGLQAVGALCIGGGGAAGGAIRLLGPHCGAVDRPLDRGAGNRGGRGDGRDRRRGVIRAATGGKQGGCGNGQQGRVNDGAHD